MYNHGHVHPERLQLGRFGTALARPPQIRDKPISLAAACIAFMHIGKSPSTIMYIANPPRLPFSITQPELDAALGAIFNRGHITQSIRQWNHRVWTVHFNGSTVAMNARTSHWLTLRNQLVRAKYVPYRPPQDFKWKVPFVDGPGGAVARYSPDEVRRRILAAFIDPRARPIVLHLAFATPNTERRHWRPGEMRGSSAEDYIVRFSSRVQNVFSFFVPLIGAEAGVSTTAWFKSFDIRLQCILCKNHEPLIDTYCAYATLLTGVDR